MDRKKAKQPVKARFTFKIKADRKIGGGVMYKRSEAYRNEIYADIVDVIIHGGVSALNEDKRVQPNSITITFNLI